MSFQQGLSGLNASAKSLDAIGNNIANSGTAGFKGASARFADVFAASLAGAGASQVGIGTSLNSVFQQFTQGNITATNNPLDLAINGGGFFRVSDEVGVASGNVAYTRNGQFSVNKDGYIVNGEGLFLTGIQADPVTGIVPSSGQPGAIRLDTSLIDPNATTQSRIQFNLDSREVPPTDGADPSTVTGSAIPGTLTITAATNDVLTLTIDGVGPQNITIPPGTYANAAALASAVEDAINANATFTTSGVGVDVTTNSSGLIVITNRSVGSIGTQGTGSTLALGGGNGEANLLGGAPVVVAGADTFDATDPLSYTTSSAQTVYDSLGNPHNMALYFVKTSQANTWQMYITLDGGSQVGPNTLSFDSSGNLVTAMPLQQNFGLLNGALDLDYTLDLSGSTQFGTTFGVNTLTQDGYTSGRLSGISVSDDGTVQGRYSNGRTRDMGRLVLATFQNPNGLQNVGGNLWAETADSGQPIEGTAGQGNLGLVQSASVEDSNVDLTAELVNMITQQRAYQANAQTIKTQDQILQTLVNLR